MGGGQSVYVAVCELLLQDGGVCCRGALEANQFGEIFGFFFSGAGW